jgi:hypothetical protein
MGSEDDFNEAIIIAREMGAVVSVEDSDGRGLMKVTVEIPT